MEPVQNREESVPKEVGEAHKEYPKLAPPSKTISELKAAEQEFKVFINRKVMAIQPVIVGSTMPAIVKSSISLFISPELMQKMSVSATDLGMSMSGVMKKEYPLLSMAIRDASLMKGESLHLMLPASWERLLHKCLKAMTNNEEMSSSSDDDDERPSKRRYEDHQQKGAGCSFVLPIMQPADDDQAAKVINGPAAHVGQDVGHGAHNEDAQQPLQEKIEQGEDEAAALPANHGSGGRRRCRRDRNNDHCGFPLT